MFLICWAWHQQTDREAKGDFMRQLTTAKICDPNLFLYKNTHTEMITASKYLNLFMQIYHTNSGSAVNGRPNLLW